MKHSRLIEFAFTYLPLLSLVLAFGIVFQQYARRDRLKDELAATERAYVRYSKRYQELHRMELVDTSAQKKAAVGPSRRNSSSFTRG